MEENKEENGRKGLLATIIILCVVAVMIAAVVVALIIKRQQEELEEPRIVAPEELLTNGPVDPDYILDLERAGDTLENVDDGVNLYEAIIAKNSDNVSALVDLRIAYSRFLLRNDRTKEALEQLDMLNKLEISSVERLQLYDAYLNYYVYLEDENKVAEYKEMMYKYAEENGLNEEGEY